MPEHLTLHIDLGGVLRRPRYDRARQYLLGLLDVKLLHLRDAGVLGREAEDLGLQDRGLLDKGVGCRDLGRHYRCCDLDY